jgi:hypothetical protein
MPFERYLRGLAAFRPEALTTLSDALAMAVLALDLSPDQEAKRDLVAQLIVQAALENEFLDAAGLSRKAVLDFRQSTNH